eukprot:scaffold6804_cov188-Ochromonas_danica.AAC.1
MNPIGLVPITLRGYWKKVYDCHRYVASKICHGDCLRLLHTKILEEEEEAPVHPSIHPSIHPSNHL